MSLNIPNAPNSNLFKQGYQNYDSEDGAVIRNIDACRTIASTVQTSLGPYGRNKIVINHLQKMILTSDAATILRELDVVHPAAKLLVMASQQQEAEMEMLQIYTEVCFGRVGELVVDKVEDMRSQAELSKAIRTVIASKQTGNEEFLANMVAEAVLAVLPRNPINFNVDNIRVVKIMGGSLEQSRVVKGMVFGREPDGSVKKATRAKVGVFSCPIDISQTETKGTVLLHNAKEMLDFTKGEEINWRLLLRNFMIPVYGLLLLVLPQENETTKTATLVLRGATMNHLDDVERAVDDGVNVVKAITRDPRLVPGAGATEIQLVERIQAFGDKTPGLAQYSIRKFGEAFEVIPRTLAESAGLDATETLSRLYTAHHKHDNWNTGVDIENEDDTGTLDTKKEGILDLMIAKSWAIKLATEAARTVLSVDQIIVARQAGGPKPPGPNPNWDED
ncbi:hypothetical protein DID88_003686 [Monilinia fructigena]|uniref:T-complex protein 1 subunit theta n=1 Tax=Monilinia fructigena TaxID=38457 RepID=A0A395IW51_9HELO|nr:hypothetical protein DID88_003686 [Monilinia fructigena]